MTLPADVRQIMAKINKSLGEGTLVLATESRPVPRITSGSLALDVVLGGGWPANQWVELIGDPSHGKTTLALKTIAANQAKNPDFVAVWVAAEEWSDSLARMCGVDSSRVILIETNVMEEVYQAVIDFADSQTVDMVVIDSLPALVPSSEDEKDMDEMTVGRGALLTNKFFRKVGKATKRPLTGDSRPFLGIMINQWRMKIGVMHGDPRTTPGGQGKDFAYYVRCEVKRDEWQEIGPSGNKRRIGQTTKIRTIKNKAAPPQQVAYVDFYFDKGGPVAKGQYDYGKEIVALGVLYDVIERKGAWFYYGDEKWNGSAALLAALRENETLRNELEPLVLETVLRAFKEDQDEE